MKIESPTLQQLIFGYLYYIEKQNFQQISDAAGISIATVSRRLKEAKECGFIKETFSFVLPDQYRNNFIENVTFPAISGRLLEEFSRKNAGLRKIIVVAGDRNPAKEVPDTVQNGFPRAQRVATHAAWLLAEQTKALLNKKPKIQVGVNWGYTVQRVCNHFKDWCDQELKQISPDNIALSGLTGLFWVDSEDKSKQALFRRAWSNSSSVNVEILAGSFENGTKIPIRIVRSPAFLSQSLLKNLKVKVELSKETEYILGTVFQADPGYNTLYGHKPVVPTDKSVGTFLNERWEAYTHKDLPEKSEKGLMNQYGTILDHDILVTSMSALTSDSGLVEFISPDVNIEKLRDEYDACGDVANHIFTKDGSYPRGRLKRNDLEQFNARILSLWPEDLRDVSQLHRETNSSEGGVILVSSGKDKAESLCVALTKLNIANYLVIDTNMAWAMYDELGINKEVKDKDFDINCFKG
jgi:DNA-binding transcriptional regulator LsrR (DeoR family)